jgi:hypothetical protein
VVPVPSDELEIGADVSEVEVAVSSALSPYVGSGAVALVVLSVPTPVSVVGAPACRQLASGISAAQPLFSAMQTLQYCASPHTVPAG